MVKLTKTNTRILLITTAILALMLAACSAGDPTTPITLPIEGATSSEDIQQIVFESTPLPVITPLPTTFIPGQPSIMAKVGKGETTGLAVSPDRSLIAVASSMGVYLYNAQTYDEIWVKWTDSMVWCVAFSPDGQTIASSSANGSITLWDVQTGSARHTLIGHSFDVMSVSFSADGMTLISGSSDGTVIIWDLTGGATTNNGTTANAEEPAP